MLFTVMKPTLRSEPLIFDITGSRLLLVSYLNPGIENTKLHLPLAVSINWSCYGVAQCLLFCLLTYRTTCWIQLLIRCRSCFRTMVPCKFTLFCRCFEGLYSFQVQDEVTNQWSMPTLTAGLSIIKSLWIWRQHGSPSKQSPEKIIA
jgi:hypothetical protein